MKKQRPAKKKYKLLSFHIVTCALFVLVTAQLLSYVLVNTEKFNPLAVAIEDFKMTDIVFKQFKDRPAVDTNIVLVNIGELNRAELAAEISLIAQWQPAVVALDAMITKNKDPYIDSILGAAIRNIPNFVLATKLDSLNEKSLKHDRLYEAIPILSQGVNSGYVNLVSGNEEGFRTTRDFTFQVPYADTIILSFPAKICQLFNPAAFEKLQARAGKNEKEIINFAGDERNFIKLDYPQLFDPASDLSFLKGKIVLMGYLGKTIDYANNSKDLVDVFYTPLNERVAGRAYPDMYGITVHANILSQMLNNRYIDQSPEWLSFGTALLIALVNIAIFLYFAKRLKNVFEAFVRILQAIQIIVFTGVEYYFLATKDYKFDLTLTITLLLVCGDLTIIYSSSIFRYVERFMVWSRKLFGAQKNIAVSPGKAE